MEVTEKIEDIVRESLAHLGYEIIRVMLQGGDVKTVQIMVERIDRKNMTVDDCEKVSRTVSALLDVEDPLSDRYMLEVSSPGIDRPLIRIADYVRFIGFDAKVETLVPMQNRRRFKGKIMGVTDDEKAVQLQTDEGDVVIELQNISKAKLILTDELLKAQSIH